MPLSSAHGELFPGEKFGMLASLGEWKEEVFISETGRDSQTGKHKNGHNTVGTDPQDMAGMGPSIQLQVNTRAFIGTMATP